MKVFLLLIAMLLFSVPSAFAQAEYVLPYPSFMPGSKLYKIKVLGEKVQKYWYFGNFAQFHYNLKQSDKYLVEAKTLFEYKQYLLADQALQKSNTYFRQAKPFLINAQNEEKNIDDKKAQYISASLKHQDVLQQLIKTVPEEFNWSPEKQAAKNLQLQDAIKQAIEIRQKCL